LRVEVWRQGGRGREGGRERERGRKGERERGRGRGSEKGRERGREGVLEDRVEHKAITRRSPLVRQGGAQGKNQTLSTS